MNAQEVINQIKVLPPEEQARVFDFVQETCSLPETAERQFKAAAKWAFEEHSELMKRLSQ